MYPMTSSDTSPEEDGDSQEEARSGPITTEEALEEALEALVTEADSNGVDVRGGWPVAHEDDTGMWDVEIVEVSRRSTAHVRDTGYPVASVVEAVASREGVETTDLPPLHETISPDILETLRQSADDIEQHVRFQYYGYRVAVRGDGSIVIEE
jgi:hypothetical protein